MPQTERRWDLTNTKFKKKFHKKKEQVNNQLTLERALNFWHNNSAALAAAAAVALDCDLRFVSVFEMWRGVARKSYYIKYIHTYGISWS